jgi:hypothetical protein
MVTRLFVIHGMGVFDDAWVEPVEAQLSEIYGGYETLSSVPQSSRFTIQPIRYDDILAGLVKKWQDDANAISGCRPAVARLSRLVARPVSVGAGAEQCPVPQDGTVRRTAHLAVDRGASRRSLRTHRQRPPTVSRRSRCCSSSQASTAGRGRTRRCVSAGADR